MNPASTTTDQSAVLVTIILLALQLGVLAWVWRETLLPLRRQRAKVMAFTKQVEDATDVEEVARPTERVLAKAWDRTLGATGAGTSAREVVEPHDAFTADVLIPHVYNGRFDAAAPGVFTALGIVGTFLGLIIAFSHVDPAQSEQSIAPLVGGMRVAFWNSLLGVFLSIVWTVGSRRARHAFDRACRELADAAEARLDHATPGGQVLQAFGLLSEKLDVLGTKLDSAVGAKLETVIAETRLARLEAKSASDTLRQALGAKLDAVVGAKLDALTDQSRLARTEATSASDRLGNALGTKLDALARATQNSSSDLVATLAPQLEKSFKSLVDTPFENLSRTVDQYRVTVEQVAERHGYVLEGLDAAVVALGAAQMGLAAATADTARCVLQFEAFVERVGAESERSAALIAERGASAAAALEAQTDRATVIVERGNDAAQALAAGVGALHEAAGRQSEVATALGGVSNGLHTASADLGRVSSTFGTAAERLEAAVGQIQRISADAAHDTARAAREELQAAIAGMSTALRDFGTQNVAAYEASSRRVIEAVDGRMSDLTERLSAELNTLMVRLPDVAESMTTAARSVRMQLERAVRGLDDAVRQLDVASRQSLKAHLEEYDGAVAKAIDHFSGTLFVWDGRVGELTGAVRRLEKAVTRKNGPPEQRDDESSADALQIMEALQIPEATLS
jgi:hypothetical protein